MAKVSGADEQLKQYLTELGDVAAEAMDHEIPPRCCPEYLEWIKRNSLNNPFNVGSEESDRRVFDK